MKLPQIELAVARAERTIYERLKLPDDVEVAFSGSSEYLIPEDGVGGRTRKSDLVVFSVDVAKNPSEQIIFEMLMHELCHAGRWQMNEEWMRVLFDGIINEGIATVFEETVAHEEERTVFLTAVLERSNEENENILASLKGKLFDGGYDYHEIFFDGNDRLPRWAGYSLGYFLVKKYLAMTDKTIEQAFADKYADFKIALEK